MSADQFAQVLEVYADLREHYVSPAARADGAFYAPETTDNDRHLMIEVSSLRNGAWGFTEPERRSSRYPFVAD
jgi:hypothetical protein